MKKVLKIVYDHWLIIFSLLLTGSISVGVVWYYFSIIKEKFLFFISYAWTGWILFLLLFLCFVVYVIVKKRRGLESLNRVIVPREESPPLEKDLGYKDDFGVKWHIWLARYGGLSDSNYSTWVKGPYCKKCLCKLEARDKKWFCVKCNRRFKIPKHISSDPLSSMEKIYDAGLNKVVYDKSK